jgi:hypothetical protein
MYTQVGNYIWVNGVFESTWNISPSTLPGLGNMPANATTVALAKAGADIHDWNFDPKTGDWSTTFQVLPNGQAVPRLSYAGDDGNNAGAGITLTFTIAPDGSIQWQVAIQSGGPLIKSFDIVIGIYPPGSKPLLGQGHILAVDDAKGSNVFSPFAGASGIFHDIAPGRYTIALSGKVNLADGSVVLVADAGDGDIPTLPGVASQPWDFGGGGGGGQGTNGGGGPTNTIDGRDTVPAL